MTTTYEFVIEELDFYTGCGDDPDIIDCPAFDTLGEALKYAKSVEGDWRLALRRDTGNDCEGLTERYYAYVGSNGCFQETMETATDAQDGPKTPKKFLDMIIWC